MRFSHSAPMETITQNEAKVIGEIFHDLAEQEGEDVVGILMKRGMKRYLPDNQLIYLASKLEAFKTYYE